MYFQDKIIDQDVSNSERTESIQDAIYTIECIIRECNDLYYDSNDYEKMNNNLSDFEYDSLKQACRYMYLSLGKKIDITEYSFIRT